MNSIIVPIGTLTLSDACDIAIPQEFAAWSQTVRVEAGTYPVVAALNWSDSAYRVGQVWARAAGTTTHAYYTAHFGGVPIGDNAYGRALIGRPAACVIHVACYWRGDASALPAGLTLTAKEIVLVSWDTRDQSIMTRMEVAKGVKAIVTRHTQVSGASVPGAFVGSLDRDAQVKLANEALERAKSPDYWNVPAVGDDLKSVRSLLTEADVLARFTAAVESKTRYRFTDDVWGVRYDYTSTI